jgi:DNA-binding NtrC family response regulator
MQRTSKTKNILIVDPDLGFVFWLGQLLDSSGSYQVLPAKSVTDAKVLIARLSVEVDLLVIGQTLEDSEHLVDNLRQSRNELPVIYLFGESEELPTCTGANAYFRKLSRFDSVSEAIWLEMVRDIFKREAPKVRVI